MALAVTGEAQAGVVALGGDMAAQALEFRAEQARNWNATVNFYSWIYYAIFPICAAIYAVRKWCGENWTKWLFIRNFIDEVEEVIVVKIRKFIIWKVVALMAVSVWMLIKLLLD